MPRRCTVCAHPGREAIDRTLVAGEPFRNIAERFSVSVAALHRHKADHLPTKLTKAQEAQEAAQADDLLRQVRALQEKTLSILLQAEGAGDLRTALGAIREARGNIELLAKLQGELDGRPVVNLLVSSEWLELRAVIVTALEPHPDARGAVLAAIGRIGNGSA